MDCHCRVTSSAATAELMAYSRSCVVERIAVLSLSRKSALSLFMKSEVKERQLAIKKSPLMYCRCVFI